ncbi:MAG: ATP-binding cassette domain-containing protein [Leptolyngbya sp. SIO1D8]|nr:ATP-binding cassette domain-containing protein [Leptolyngbya sp. SIO1D8]
MSSLLTLKKVSLQASVGQHFILDKISLDIEPGEFVALVGPSGAGKTSLLKLMNRLKSASSGTICFQGDVIETLSVFALRQKVMLVGQDCHLLGMTVQEALHYPLRLQGLSEKTRTARVLAWADKLKLPQEWWNRTELQLSGGQQQQVAITRALVAEPTVLLLDEPTSAQDLGTATRILSVIQTQVRTQGLSVIMSNHQLDLVQAVCDRVLYLEDGCLFKDQQASEVDWQDLRQSLLKADEKRQEEWGDD